MEESDLARFVGLARRRGLLHDRIAHYEHHVIVIGGTPYAVPWHPEFVRQLVELAAETVGDGQGVHAELIGLYAKREELMQPTDEARAVTWRDGGSGPLLDPDNWIRLDVWLDDQFLLEDALQLEGGPWSDRDDA